MVEHVESLQEAVRSKNARFEMVVMNDPHLAATILQDITTKSDQITSYNQRISMDTQRLIQLEEQLMRLEEEAEKSARGVLCFNHVYQLSQVLFFL